MPIRYADNRVRTIADAFLTLSFQTTIPKRNSLPKMETVRKKTIITSGRMTAKAQY